MQNPTKTGSTLRANQHWVDTYDAKGILEGASTFEAGYVRKTDQFAYAHYTFESFMDTGQVTKIANMVKTKYGAPSAHGGNDNLGEVTYKWNLPADMIIEVSRAWPSTTTYLAYGDRHAISEMNAEIDASKQMQVKQKAQEQDHAF